jgi:hypothetical protein
LRHNDAGNRKRIQRKEAGVQSFLVTAEYKFNILPVRRRQDPEGTEVSQPKFGMATPALRLPSENGTGVTDAVAIRVHCATNQTNARPSLGRNFFASRWLHETSPLSSGCHGVEPKFGSWIAAKSRKKSKTKGALRENPLFSGVCSIVPLFLRCSTVLSRG